MTDESVATQVAWACRILAAHGYEDLTLGHVSARQDHDPEVMWIKRKGVSLSEVTPEDVLRASIEGDIENATDMHLESVLHTEVYRILCTPPRSAPPTSISPSCRMTRSCSRKGLRR